MVVQTRPYQERIGPRLLAERSASLQSSSGVANSSPLNTHSRRTCVPPRPFQERERPFPKQASPIQQRLQASSSDFRALGTRYRPPVAVPWPSVPTSGPWALGFRPPVAIPWPSVPFQAPHSLTATPGSSLLSCLSRVLALWQSNPSSADHCPAPSQPSSSRPSSMGGRESLDPNASSESADVLLKCVPRQQRWACSAHRTERGSVEGTSGYISLSGGEGQSLVLVVSSLHRCPTSLCRFRQTEDGTVGARHGNERRESFTASSQPPAQVC